jgi:hypothetical protein
MSRNTFPTPEPETGPRATPRAAKLAENQPERNMTKTIVTKWITVLIERHPDCGGGCVEADLPDTPYHRAYYKVLRSWSQRVEA